VVGPHHLWGSIAKGRRMVLVSSRSLMTDLPWIVCVDDSLVLTNLLLRMNLLSLD
jgi:hypothetical protein